MAKGAQGAAAPLLCSSDEVYIYRCLRLTTEAFVFTSELFSIEPLFSLSAIPDGWVRNECQALNSVAMYKGSITSSRHAML